MFKLNKMSLIITTRCNLKCNMCCEYIPEHKPFPDMTLDEEKRILDALFKIYNRIETLHLTGGGEPLLHKQLTEMISLAMQYQDRFDRLMIFTNCTIPLTQELTDTLIKYKEKIFIQLSLYGVKHEAEKNFVQLIESANIPHRVRKYYGEDQAFGGWVNFGNWEKGGLSSDELENKFQGCAVTRVFGGNWRTRDGKVHWCSRSQRGTELGLLPDFPSDYVDLLDDTSIGEKRAKFEQIAGRKYINACDYCSGEQGTEDTALRVKAAQQTAGSVSGDNI